MRVLWLALADARGHLMRAQLAHGALARRGVSVDVVTTSRAGVEFLAAFGVRAERLSSRFRLEYDEHQNLLRARNEAGMLRYLALGLRADRRRLARLAEGADLCVNDSFHPALLFAPRGCRVVQVYGRHMRRAVEENFAGRRFSPAYAAAMRALVERSFACIEHTLGESGRAASVHRLPPLLARPRREAAAVRAALGAGPGRRLAVVYLNPHFRDPRVAEAVERGLAGWVVHAVGEGYATRPGWRGVDPDLASVVAAADVLVSTPGMGALAQASVFGTPLVALVTDQPEQQRNLAFLDGARFPRAIVPLAGDLAARLGRAALGVGGGGWQRADARAAVIAVEDAWARTFVELIGQREEGTTCLSTGS